MQSAHDEVNLARLVRRIEKTVASETWADDDSEDSPSTPAWIRSRGTLHKLKYARKLLQTVVSNEDGGNSPRASLQRYDQFRRALDRLESMVSEVDKKLAQTIPKPAPILPTLPLPVLPVSAPTVSEEVLSEVASTPDPATTLLPAEETSAITAHERILSPSISVSTPRGPINPTETLLPPSLPAAAEKSTPQATPAFMQNSAALQEELSAQLAQMATQLKRNAVHFASALESDKAVVLEAQEKLERNHDVMSKERVRLRDHHSKSWGTTWITLLSLIVVAVGFFMTFLVIRVT